MSSGIHNVRSTLLAFILPCMWAATALAQPTSAIKSELDGLTPPSFSSGTPAGSYALSGFETVNLYSGSLNFRLPLMKVGGTRGESAYTMMLPIQEIWHAEQGVACDGSSGGSCAVQAYYASPSSWNSIPDPYGPGRLDYRYSQVPYEIAHCQSETGGYLPFEALTSLTRLTFTAADGTEYELRDDLYNGEPKSQITGDICTGYLAANTASRGNAFSTHDGSAVRFVSDDPIVDAWQAIPPNGSNPPTGNLLFPDGSLYRILCGQVSYIRDRNGNKTIFRYENTWTYSNGACTMSGALQGRLTQVVDSLGRQITIVYGEFPGTIGTDVISFTGLGGSWRTIEVHWNNLSGALRSDYTSAGVQLYAALFPEFSLTAGPFNPTVVDSVLLPNGQSYSFKYNPYGELASAALPTGGGYEYDVSGGYPNTTSGALVTGSDASIYRRVVARRVYATYTDHSSAAVLTQTFTASSVSGGSTASPGEGLLSYKGTTTVGVQTVGVNHVQSTDTHYFTGDPSAAANLSDPVWRMYVPWQEGREFQMDSSGLKSVFQTWQQGGQTSWWTTPSACLLTVSDISYGCTSQTMPPENPQVVQIDTELLDISPAIFSRETRGYDSYNNPTDTSFYDYATIPQRGAIQSGTPGQILKQTHTDYEWSANSSYISSSTVFLPRIPQAETISLNGTAATKTTYEYDVYQTDTRHSPLLARSGIVQMDSSYSSASATVRGNVTGMTRGLGTDATTTSLEYDVAGNVVAMIDGNAHGTSYDRDSNSYTSPAPPTKPTNYEAPPSGSTYGFLTKITDPVGHQTSVGWELDLGKPNTITEPTQLITTATYGGTSDTDLLDRLSKLVRGDTTTTYSYVDTPGQVAATAAKSVVTATNTVNSTSYYDGLGRVNHTSTGTSDPILADTVYDGLSRVYQVSNPYRTGDTTVPTTTTYDSLGRVLRVTHNDTSYVQTSYSGNTVMVTDEAGAQRVSQLDGLGRTTQVAETGIGATTGYTYDALDNLASVTQGSQGRQFSYDSLSRLTAACNPESVPDGTNNLSPAVSCLTPPSSQAVLTRYTYDPAGNLTLKTEPESISTILAYDAANRLVSKTYTGGLGTPAAHYCYDGQSWNGTACAGNAITTSSGLRTAEGNTQSWTNLSYDSSGMGRVMNSYQTTLDRNGVQNLYTFGYRYYAGDLLASITYPSNRTVTNCYDDNGRVKWVSSTLLSSQCLPTADSVATAGNAYASAIHYFAHGPLQNFNYGNLTPASSLVETWAYNDRLQPTNITLGVSQQSPLWQVGYQYTRGSQGNNGNLMGQTLSAPGTSMVDSYAYDAANRLMIALEGPVASNSAPICSPDVAITGWCQQYGYDQLAPGSVQLGNRLIAVRSWNDVAGLAEPTAFNLATNRATGTNWSYGDRGGITHDPFMRGYGYDAEGRMVSTCAGGEVPCPDVWGSTFQREIYTFDADGRRVREDKSDGTWTIFVYDASGDLAAEYSTVAQTVTGLRYITADSLGSTRVITDSTGAVTERHDYQPFGVEMSVTTDSPRYGITGYPGLGRERR